MAAYVSFESYTKALAEKKLNLSTDSLKIALVASANTPDPATATKLADLVEIDYTFAGSRVITSSTTFAAGQTTVTASPLTLTATGGDIGPFQYVVAYDDSSVDKDLIAMWDLGSVATILDGNSGTFTFATGALQVIG